MIVNKFQHMDLKQWSHDSNAFKTITSESETRNQTTNKKQNSKMRSSHLNSITKAIQTLSVPEMKRLISQLEHDKSLYIENNNYKKLIKLNRRIKQIQQIIKNKQDQQIKTKQQQQQIQLYKIHEQQMRDFNQTWEDIFENFDRKQHIMRMRLKTQEQRDVRIAKQKIMYKTAQLDRKMANDKRYKQILNIQNKYVKKGMFQELIKMNIEEKKKMIIKDIRSQRNQTIKKMHKQQQQKLREIYRKRYNSLNNKIQQCKNYEVKIYKKHENRLKQKFLNAVSKLDRQNNLRESKCQSLRK